MRINVESRMPVSKICVADTGPDSKRQFYQIMRSVVTRHKNRESFDRVAMSLIEEKVWMAYWETAGVGEMGRGAALFNPTIHVCEADFVIGRSDYRDLIPLVVHHETTEAWNVVARRMFSYDPEVDEEYGDESHQIALVEEFCEAIRRGVGERHIEFIRKAAETQPKDYRNYFLRENERAYRKALKLMKRK